MRVKGWRRVSRKEELDQSKAPSTRLAGDPDDCECAEEPELLTFPRTRPRHGRLAHDRQRIEAAARDLLRTLAHATARTPPTHAQVFMVAITETHVIGCFAAPLFACMKKARICGPF